MTHDLAARRAIRLIALALDVEAKIPSVDFRAVVERALSETDAEAIERHSPIAAAAPVEPENATDPPRCPNCGSTKTGPTSGNGVGNTMDCLACYADFTPADAPVEPEEGGCDVCSNPNCYRNILPEDGK